ncbi:MAG: ATP synthase F1 subunit epsilon [Acetivibrionales bacterium]|jgi:F-type H+-transporting ATPase subunit epsilon
MASNFHIEIVTPERLFYSGDVEMIVLTTPDGQMGVLHGHIPMVVAVAVGPMKMLQNGAWKTAFLSEGFMQVRQERTIILVDTAEWPHEIDENRAIAAKERAEERLRNKTSHKEYIQSQAALTRAIERLKVKKKIEL